MKIKMMAAGLGLLLGFLTSYGQNQESKNAATIKELDRELEAALLKGDSITLDRLLAHDYLEINAQGRLSSKRDVIAIARARTSSPSAISVGPERTVDDLTIRLHGNSALVAGRTTIRYQFMEYQTLPGVTQPQSPVSVDQERFIRTYAKVGKRWQLVAWQTTSIPKQ